MSQQELIAFDNINLEDIDRIVELQGDSTKWPVVLAELHTLVVHNLAQSGLKAEQAKSLGFTLTLSIADHLGGAQEYLPRGDALRRQIRNMRMYDEFNGRNHLELSKRYGITERAAYEILAKQRAIEIRQRQPSLF
ncbi:Mor transcription activator family protein [Vibrio nomapromontoriensis]|uniref:Mor transcription activator family protein n=1 Tax=Vibrio nomapromontoriensis TaxID=2910246 RepID=UPI003D0E9BD2